MCVWVSDFIFLGGSFFVCKVRVRLDNFERRLIWCEVICRVRVVSGEGSFVEGVRGSVYVSYINVFYYRVRVRFIRVLMEW